MIRTQKLIRWQDAPADETTLARVNGSAHERETIDLAPLRAGKSESVRFPLGDTLGRYASWVQDSAEAKNCPGDYPGLTFLVAAATAIGCARYVSAWRTFTEPCVLWGCNVGDPSAGKSPGMSAVLEALYAVEAQQAYGFEEKFGAWQIKAENAEASKMQWKEDIKKARKTPGAELPPVPLDAVCPEPPQRPRLVIQDATQEAIAPILSGNPKGVVSARHELAGWFGNHERYSGGGSDRPFWLECYDAHRVIVDRVKNKGAPIVVPRSFVGVVGGLQPDLFRKAIASSVDDGLSSRFLYAWPESIPFQRPTRSAPRSVIEQAFARLRGLHMVQGQDGPEPLVIPLSAEAEDVFANWCSEHKSAGPYYGKYASWWGKGLGQTLRLALVLQLLDWAFDGEGQEPAEVGLEAMLSALTLYDEYFAPMARKVFDDAGLPEAERKAATLAHWLTKHRPTGIINARELRRKKLQGLKASRDVHEALDILVAANWIEPCPGRAGDTPGRAREDFMVNPGLWEVIDGQMA